MNTKTKKTGHWLAGFSLLLMSLVGTAEAVIDGVTGQSFNFTAKPAIISTPDGDSLLVWGYGLDGGPMQYPGPTLIVNQGDTITITLTNGLGVANMPVSLVFPGQEGVIAHRVGHLPENGVGPADLLAGQFLVRAGQAVQVRVRTRRQHAVA